MNKKKRILFLLSLVYLVGQAAASPLPPVKRNQDSIGFSYKVIQYAEAETVQLLGCSHLKYIGPDFYWGEVGYGAIQGSRSGYIEGGLLVGYQVLANSFTCDITFFTGPAGGGKDMKKEGGGWVVYPGIQLGGYLFDRMTIKLTAGYMKFLSGTLESPWFSFDLEFHYEENYE